MSTTDLILASLPKSGNAFESTEQQIGETRKFLSLTIGGVTDKEGIKKANEARLICVRIRTAIDKARKELKAPAVEYGKRIDAEAARLTAINDEAETYLTKLVKNVAAEQAVLDFEVENQLFESRLKLISDVGGLPIQRAMLVKMKDAEFANVLETAKVAAEQRAETARLNALQAEANRLEREQIAAERAELDREKQANRAESDRLAKIETDRVAGEKAKADAEALAVRQAAEAEANWLAEVQRLEHVSAMKPHREKIEELAQFLDWYQLPGGLPGEILDRVIGVFKVASDSLLQIAKELS